MDGSSSALAPYSDLSRDELEAQITELAGQLNAANYRWLTLIAEFDRRQAWADGSLHSCAHWLNFKVGLNVGAAREKVRVAHALAGVPKIAAAMARGELPAIPGVASPAVPISAIWTPTTARLSRVFMLSAMEMCPTDLPGSSNAC